MPIEFLTLCEKHVFLYNNHVKKVKKTKPILNEYKIKKEQNYVRTFNSD